MPSFWRQGRGLARPWADMLGLQQGMSGRGPHRCRQVGQQARPTRRRRQRLRLERADGRRGGGRACRRMRQASGAARGACKAGLASSATLTTGCSRSALRDRQSTGSCADARHAAKERGQQCVWIAPYMMARITQGSTGTDPARPAQPRRQARASASSASRPALRASPRRCPRRPPARRPARPAALLPAQPVQARRRLPALWQAWRSARAHVQVRPRSQACRAQRWAGWRPRHRRRRRRRRRRRQRSSRACDRCCCPTRAPRPAPAPARRRHLLRHRRRPQPRRPARRPPLLPRPLRRHMARSRGLPRCHRLRARRLLARLPARRSLRGLRAPAQAPR